MANGALAKYCMIVPPMAPGTRVKSLPELVPGSGPLLPGLFIPDGTSGYAGREILP